MRTNLKVLRVKRDLSQDQIAKEIGCSRQSYQSIENGARDGKRSFWESLQNAFSIPDADMWELQRND